MHLIKRKDMNLQYPNRPPPTPPDDKENTSKKKKKHTKDIVIICILALIVFILIVYIAPMSDFQTKQKMTMIIVDDVIDTPANTYTYYKFYVPAGTSNTRITGNYEVHGDLIQRINIYLADASLCSSPIGCSSYYYIGEEKSFGKVDVYLSTRSQETTYYLAFQNVAPLGESKQTEASFKLEGS